MISSVYQWGWVPQAGAVGGLGLGAPSPLAPGYFNPEIPSAWSGGLVAWLRVGQASWVFWCLGVVIAVAAPGLLGHLPSISDLGVKYS